jgi:ligand-binding SRPBCC domain-containing protein
MATYRLETSQEVNASMEEVWDFISSPKNLKHITPEHMGFDILTPNLPEKMYPGMMIEYSVKPLFGIPMKWLSEITQVKEMDYFIDEQRSGPYSMWHHEHKITQTEKGVLITDIIHYIPPMGFLGAIANTLIIKNQLKQIFDFRTVAVDKKFPRK